MDFKCETIFKSCNIFTSKRKIFYDMESNARYFNGIGHFFCWQFGAFYVLSCVAMGASALEAVNSLKISISAVRSETVRYMVVAVLELLRQHTVNE